MRIVLYEPDIPQNVGSIIRTATCLGCPVHIIEPCGFPFSVKALRRAAMDYADKADITRHTSFDHFEKARAAAGGALVLMTTKAKTSFWDFSFKEDNWLLFGRESAGVPAHVRNLADTSLTIPMQPGFRSLNLAVSAGMVLGEALRQTRQENRQ